MECEAQGHLAPSIVDHFLALRSTSTTPESFPALHEMCTSQVEEEPYLFIDYALHAELSLSCPLSSRQVSLFAPFAELLWLMIHSGGRGEGRGLGDLLHALLEDVDMRDYITGWSADLTDLKERWANVEELVANADTFSKMMMRTRTASSETIASREQGVLVGAAGEGEELSVTPRHVLCSFLEEMDVTEEATPTDTATVQLMTIHRSKGLEFDNVIICGMEEGLLPLARANVAEERRLAYVAATRARDMLIITYAQSRTNTEGFQWSSGMSHFLEPLRRMDSKSCIWMN